jgi:hypothetical protein
LRLKPLSSLQGKESPERRFFGILSAKRNKLLGRNLTEQASKQGLLPAIAGKAHPRWFLNLELPGEARNSQFGKNAVNLKNPSNYPVI